MGAKSARRWEGLDVTCSNHGQLATTDAERVRG